MTSKDYVQDEFRSFSVTLNDYDEYDIIRLVDVFKTIISEAEANGYTDVKLRFESTMVPRFESTMVPNEDCLGSPQVFAVGLRKQNKDKLKELTNE